MDRSVLLFNGPYSPLKAPPGHHIYTIIQSFCCFSRRNSRCRLFFHSSPPCFASTTRCFHSSHPCFASTRCSHRHLKSLTSGNQLAPETSGNHSSHLSRPLNSTGFEVAAAAKGLFLSIQLQAPLFCQP